VSWIDWSSVVAWARDWQPLLAGLIGFLAALLTVWVVLRSERRKQSRELLALKRALGSEIRQLTTLALDAHERCAADLAKGSGITIEALQDACRFPVPLVYQDNAGRVGHFGEAAHEIVLFFGQISVLKDAVPRLGSATNPQGRISRENTIGIAGDLLRICEIGEFLLPRMRAGYYFRIADERFRARLASARSSWQKQGEPIPSSD
jgi:hypothetical protein